jgi:hypothetical protein
LPDKLQILFFVFCLWALCSNFAPAYGQVQGEHNQVLPETNLDLAEASGSLRPPQNPEPENLQPIDLTPVKLPERANAFNPMETYRAQALYRLPGRLFFNASVENSLRLETNVLQTLRNNRADMIYRVLPNITIGWALNKKTRIATNYFMFRDQYTRQNPLLSRNIHSVGFRIDRDIPINEKTNLTAGFFARELLFNLYHAANHPLSDLIPSLVLTRRCGQNGVIYGSTLGQFRFRDVIGRYQEIDQFYSLGTVFRKHRWIFLADTTFIVNTGHKKLRGGDNNEIVVITLEAGRSISRRLPIVAFVRAEPIFNIGANSSPGFAGFNFRVFGGLRVEMAKPPIFPIKLKQS